MRSVPIFMLAFGALVVASPFPSESESESEPQPVIIRAAPSHVSETGAVPIPVSEVLRSIEKNTEEEETPAEDRFDMDLGGWGKDWGKKLKKLFKFGKEEHGGWGGWEGGHHGGMAGPFAFQLGAYYNPYIPIAIPYQPTNYGGGNYGGHSYGGGQYGGSYGGGQSYGGPY